MDLVLGSYGMNRLDALQGLQAVVVSVKFRSFCKRQVRRKVLSMGLGGADRELRAAEIVR
jgi:hypothetical protein